MCLFIILSIECRRALLVGNGIEGILEELANKLDVMDHVTRQNSGEVKIAAQSLQVSPPGTKLVLLRSLKKDNLTSHPHSSRGELPGLSYNAAMNLAALCVRHNMSPLKERPGEALVALPPTHSSFRQDERRTCGQATFPGGQIKHLLHWAAQMT